MSNDIVLHTYACILSCFYFSAITVNFTQSQYRGSEASGFVSVSLELIGGSSVNPFSVTVTPLEWSPVSAQGNVYIIVYVLSEEFNKINRSC